MMGTNIPPVFFFPAFASFSAFIFSFAIAVTEEATSLASPPFNVVIDNLITALSKPI